MSSESSPNPNQNQNPLSDNNNDESRMIGQVKWFNNKAGYGFITVSDGKYVGKDIFAHYSTIRVGDTQYRYLVQGEYVEFQLSISTNTAHEFQATHISGIKGGLLMCETRQSARPARKEQEHNDTPKQVSTSSDRISDKIFSSERRRPDKRPQKNSHSPSFKAQVPMMDVDGFKVVSKKRNV